MKPLSALVVGLLSVGTASATPLETRSQNINDCLNSKKVPVHWPNSQEYSTLAKPFNTRLVYKPKVIVYPQTNQQVQDAVSCANQCGVKVQAKSGGHSYASFSSGGKDGVMMIDLEPMQKIEVDKKTGIAKVGGGVRLGNLAQGIFDQGKRALSHGTCPGVGIGGHFTHGGYGHTSRNWGLALDHIVRAEVVLANGTLVDASETQASDIFWAVRGAADSFGIVTNFYLKTHEAPTDITYFAFQWGDALFKSKKDFTNTFMHIQDFSKNASVVDSRISYGIYLDGASAYNLGGAFFGTVDEFNSKIKPELLRSIPQPSNTTVQSYGWIDYLKLVSDRNSIKEPLTNYPDHDEFFAKSITVPEKDGLTANTLNAFYDYITKPSPTSFFVIINLYGGPGSQINTKDTNFAAYNDRDSLFVFQNYGEKASTPGVVDYINGINKAIINAQPQTHFGAYLNYVDPSYSAAEAHKLYYGDALYAKLAALKTKVDPKSTYWNPQAIGT